MNSDQLSLLPEEDDNTTVRDWLRDVTIPSTTTLLQRGYQREVAKLKRKKNPPTYDEWVTAQLNKSKALIEYLIMARREWYTQYLWERIAKAACGRRFDPNSDAAEELYENFFLSDELINQTLDILSVTKHTAYYENRREAETSLSLADYYRGAEGVHSWLWWSWLMIDMPDNLEGVDAYWNEEEARVWVNENLQQYAWICAQEQEEKEIEKEPEKKELVQLAFI